MRVQSISCLLNQDQFEQVKKSSLSKYDNDTNHNINAELEYGDLIKNDGRSSQVIKNQPEVMVENMTSYNATI